jgi:predicted nucleotidyltransferase
VLRLDPEVHARLRRAAGEAGLSLNEYCARRLAADSVGLSARAGPAGAVGRASRLLGNHLVAVAVYGSWARGEPTSESDVDLLVVVERSVRISRDLYRRWDEVPVEWDGRRVEPHFASLPDPEERIAGVWAEVALNGIVLSDDELRLSERLVRVRRDIAEGRIVRRTSHGQPYWVVGEVA